MTNYQEDPGLRPEDVQARKAEKGEKNKTTNKKILKGGAYVVGAFILLGIGGAAGSNADDKAEEVEVIKEVEVPGETETVTDVVEVVPQVCIDAIDKGSEIIGSTAPIFGELIPQALDAAYAHDNATIESLTVELDSWGGDFAILGEEYTALKIECAGYPTSD